MERVLKGNTIIEEYVNRNELKEKCPEWVRSVIPGLIFMENGHPWFVLIDNETGDYLLIYSKDIKSR